MLLTCANQQCSGAGLELPVWRAQQHHEVLGLDCPRPVLQGRPVPDVVPLTADRPWWGLTHGGHLLTCQNDRLCQVYGLGLGLGQFGCWWTTPRRCPPTGRCTSAACG